MGNRDDESAGGEVSALQLNDQVALPSKLLFDEGRREGRVVAIAEDGLVTAEFPQTGAPPMRVDAPRHQFVLVRRAPNWSAFRERHEAHRAEMPDDPAGEVYCCHGCELASDLIAALEGRGTNA